MGKRYWAHYFCHGVRYGMERKGKKSKEKKRKEKNLTANARRWVKLADTIWLDGMRTTTKANVMIGRARQGNVTPTQPSGPNTTVWHLYRN
jgi:hypothetical protein